MKEYLENERVINRAVFGDKIVRLVLCPILFTVVMVAYIKGLPSPIGKIAIVFLAYFINAKISLVLIKKRRHPLRTYRIRLIIDAVLLTILVHFTGGIESPAFILLGVLFLMAAMILPFKQSIVIFIFGSAVYVGEIWLEFSEIIPHIHIFNIFKPTVFQDTEYVLIFSLIIIPVLICMACLTAYMTGLLDIQFAKLKKAKINADNLVQDLRQAKESLERKVEERTAKVSESEEKYRSIVEKSFDGIFILQDNVFKFVNRRFEEITGRSAEELASIYWKQLIAPESLDLVTERMMKNQRGEKTPENYEFVGVNKDGKKIDCAIYATIINYEGRPAVQAYVMDITARKKAEAELQYLTKFNENILENARDMVFVHDARGRILFANKATLETTGFAKEELLGNNYRKFSMSDSVDTIKRKMEYRKGNEITIYESTLLTKAGDRIPVEINATLLEDNGDIIGSIVIGRDMRGVKRLEQEIKKTKLFLENVIESSIDGITTLDKHGFITFLNKGTEDLFISNMGYRDRTEVLGTHISQYYLGGMDEARNIFNLLKEKGGKLHNYETMLSTKQGDKIPIIVSISQLKNEKNEVIGTLGIFKDATAKKKLEEEIKHRNEELENFVYTISHDLKSPLVSLQGFASILSVDYENKLDEKGQHYLNRINKNATHMENLIRDLLELSRIGRVVGAFEEFDVSKVVEDVVEEFKPQLEAKGIKLTLHNHLPTVFCDRNRIRQVFENLISNSIKFVSTTKNPAIEIGHKDGGDYYEFYVQDNGIGIDKKYHEKIFMIFQRLQEIEEAEGTGVGLAIAKRIVENHRGNIWVESEKGKGATFHFTIMKRRSF